MEIIGWIMFAVLMSVFVGSLLGKLFYWAFREPLERNGKHERREQDEAYPRWYE